MNSVTNSVHQVSGAKRRGDLSVIRIPRHFDQFRGSIVCAQLEPIQYDRHFTDVFGLSTVDHVM